MKGLKREEGCKVTFDNVLILIGIGKEARKEAERQ